MQFANRRNRKTGGEALSGAFLLVPLLALAGCHISAVESDKILVDTRGIPIARVVIEGIGPGGDNDLVPVTYERVIETGLFISDLPFFMFLWGVFLTGLYAYWLLNKERKEHRATRATVTTIEKLRDQ